MIVMTGTLLIASEAGGNAKHADGVSAHGKESSGPDVK